MRDFGKPCFANGHAFTGILDAPDDTLNMGGVNVLVHSAGVAMLRDMLERSSIPAAFHDLDSSEGQRLLRHIGSVGPLPVVGRAASGVFRDDERV